MAEHFSVTQLQMYQKCPAQYEFRYVKGLRIPPGVAQIRGISVHKSVGVNMRSKKETGEPVSLDVALDTARDQVNGSFQRGIVLTEEEKSEGLEKVKGRVIDVAVDLAGLHYREVAPEVEPSMVEERVTLKVGKKGPMPRDVVVVLDLADAQDRIRDTKTKEKSPNENEAKESQQLTTQAMAFAAKTKRFPQDLILDHLVRTPGGKKTKPTVKVVRQVTTRDREDMTVLLARMQASLKAIEAGSFPPQPNGWHCHPKWCGYWDRCPYVRK